MQMGRGRGHAHVGGSLMYALTQSRVHKMHDCASPDITRNTSAILGTGPERSPGHFYMVLAGGRNIRERAVCTIGKPP